MGPLAFKFGKAVKRVKFHLAHGFITFCRWLPGSWHRNMGELGQSLEFSLWVGRQFHPKYTFMARREQLWQHMMAGLKSETALTVFEFGVAYGHATHWWLSHCSPIKAWYGFDTFNGLPRAWRHFPAGAFSTAGQPPQMDDARIQWVVGRVEETLTKAWLQDALKPHDPSTQRLFLLDLDLYESTLHVLERIFPYLREGDILYFDEAADWDERRALMNIWDTSTVHFKLIGATPMALALQVVIDYKPSQNKSKGSWQGAKR